MPNEKLSEVLSELARCLTVLENDNRELYNRAIEIEEEDVSMAVQQRAFHTIRNAKNWQKTLEQYRKNMEDAGIFNEKFDGIDSITASKAVAAVRRISELSELEGHASGKYYAPTNFASVNFTPASYTDEQEHADVPLFNEPEPEPVHRSAAEIPLDTETVDATDTETDPYDNITSELSKVLSDIDNNAPDTPDTADVTEENSSANTSEADSDDEAFFDDSEQSADQDIQNIVDPFTDIDGIADILDTTDAFGETDESGITIKHDEHAPAFDMSESLNDSDFEDFFLDPNLVDTSGSGLQNFSAANGTEIFNDALVDFETDLSSPVPAAVRDTVKPGNFGGKKPKSVMIFGSETKVNNWRDLFKTICEALTLAAPFIAQQFSGNEDINTPKRIFSNFEADIKGDKMKLSSGVWVSADLTSDEIYTVSRKLFALCGKPANSFSIRT